MQWGFSCIIGSVEAHSRLIPIAHHLIIIPINDIDRQKYASTGPNNIHQIPQYRQQPDDNPSEHRGSGHIPPQHLIHRLIPIIGHSELLLPKLLSEFPGRLFRYDQPHLRKQGAHGTHKHSVGCATDRQVVNCCLGRGDPVGEARDDFVALPDAQPIHQRNVFESLVEDLRQPVDLRREHGLQDYADCRGEEQFYFEVVFEASGVLVDQRDLHFYALQVDYNEEDQHGPEERAQVRGGGTGQRQVERGACGFGEQEVDHAQERALELDAELGAEGHRAEHLPEYIFRSIRYNKQGYARPEPISRLEHIIQQYHQKRRKHQLPNDDQYIGNSKGFHWAIGSIPNLPSGRSKGHEHRQHLLNPSINPRIPLILKIGLEQPHEPSKLHGPAGRDNGRDTELHEGATAGSEDDAGPVEGVGGLGARDPVQRDLGADQVYEEGDGSVDGLYVQVDWGVGFWDFWEDFGQGLQGVQEVKAHIPYFPIISIYKLRKNPQLQNQDIALLCQFLSAAFKWSSSMTPFPSFKHTQALSFTTCSICAPLQFFVCSATNSIVRFVIFCFFDYRWTLRMPQRSSALGRQVRILRSKRPGRRRAQSTMFQRLVAPMTKRLLFSQKPSIYVSSWFIVEFFQPQAELKLFDRKPMASISSMKIMQPFGQLRAQAKSQRILLGPTPTQISWNSAAEQYINSTPLSQAVALAIIVLPVPGGPYNKIPLLVLAPISLYLAGFLKQSMNSLSLSLISSFPNTSLKNTGLLLVFFGFDRLQLGPLKNWLSGWTSSTVPAHISPRLSKGVPSTEVWKLQSILGILLSKLYKYLSKLQIYYLGMPSTDARNQLSPILKVTISPSTIAFVMTLSFAFWMNEDVMMGVVLSLQVLQRQSAPIRLSPPKMQQRFSQRQSLTLLHIYKQLCRISIGNSVVQKRGKQVSGDQSYWEDSQYTFSNSQGQLSLLRIYLGFILVLGFKSNIPMISSLSQLSTLIPEQFQTYPQFLTFSSITLSSSPTTATCLSIILQKFLSFTANSPVLPSHVLCPVTISDQKLSQRGTPLTISSTIHPIDHTSIADQF